MAYQLTDTNSIIRLSDNTFIPKDTRNLDYREFLQWVEEGNEPLPYFQRTIVDQVTDLNKAKEIAIVNIKQTTFTLLQPTDWYVIRLYETTTPIPEDISSFRNTIRNQSIEKIEAVNNKETLESLKDYLRTENYQNWVKL